MNRLTGCLVAIAACLLTQSVQATPAIFSAWLDKYPSSTLPARITSATGTACNICHHPTKRTLEGTCYRMDLKELINAGGLSVIDALNQLDGEDSDGDGVPNGVEILMPRFGNPSEIGYHPGLIGTRGTDPCAANTFEGVTNMAETPQTGIPAVSTWGVMVLMLLIMTAGTMAVNHRRKFVAEATWS